MENLIVNQPMELPRVDRVLVIAGYCREFDDWASRRQPDRCSQGQAQWGQTIYSYVSGMGSLRGYDPDRTRYLLVGQYWRKSALINEAALFYALAVGDGSAMGELTKHVTDLDYTVVATPDAEEYGVGYVIYEGANYSEAVPLVEGHVKWDGCSDWNFDLVHCCTRDDLINIGKVLALCWDWTADLCPNWTPD